MLTTPAPTLPPPPHRTSATSATSRPEAAHDTVTRVALRARTGDPDAVEAFVRALHRDVWRYVAHLAGDPRLADDLTQETFLRALRSLHRFEGRSTARTWLLSIARHTVVDSLRRAAARPRTSPGRTGAAPSNRRSRAACPGSRTAWRSSTCWRPCRAIAAGRSC